MALLQDKSEETNNNNERQSSKIRDSPIELAPEEFRTMGYKLVDEISDFLGSIRDRKVTPGESPSDLRRMLEARFRFPEKGEPAGQLMNETAGLVLDHSLFNGHPRFWGFITSSAAPIGALGDLLASAVNPNVGAWEISPIASEIEFQTIRWLCEMVDYPSNAGGILVSGGNMANFVCVLVARRIKSPWDVQALGVGRSEKGSTLRIYASTEAHNWIKKAADLFGFGTDCIHWINVDKDLRMDSEELRRAIREDRDAGLLPFMVAGTAGTVSTGAVDPLKKIADICKENDTWFHIDGSYGAFAAILPDSSEDLKAFKYADSLALDPHKWLYAPLEAGCALVRKAEYLPMTFGHKGTYYHLSQHDESEVLPTNFYEISPQNSRSFRALKVWLALRQVGKEGYVKMISDDIRLSREMFNHVRKNANLEAFTQSLSIATFRFVPQDLRSGGIENRARVEEYLNNLNEKLLDKLQTGGEIFLSNALIEGKFLLRACVVNFRTTSRDAESMVEVVVRVGKEMDEKLRPASLK